MAIDFENGIVIPVKLHKKHKTVKEIIDGKVFGGEVEYFIFEFRQGTASDRFISTCLEDLDYCYNPTYKLKGTEFVAFVTYPLGKAVRVFFSEPSSDSENYHLYLMTMDYNDRIRSSDGKNFELEIIPRDQEEQFGNV